MFFSHDLRYFTVTLGRRFKIHKLCFTQFSSISNFTHISTPIFYVNASPHIGHLHSAVLADAIYRTNKLINPEKGYIFSTGTDEHGLKIQQAALNAKKNPKEFCDEISLQFKNLFDCTHVSYTDYIRTTEQRHKDVVQKFWENLKSKGWIYKDIYKGWYCMSEEAFVKEIDTMEIETLSGKQRVTADSKQPVEWMEEENYMFKLSEFEKEILAWLDKKPIKPDQFSDILAKTVSQGLRDLSISRQSSRLQWGIPVPEDSSQTIYVWLDALLNYITVSGTLSKKIHVIGKDILKFHGIYWPAFLIASGHEPPERIICHSHWTVDNEKMSKSKGNVVDPFKSIERFSNEGLRYFLLREGVPHSDGNYNDEKCINLLNADLANTLGNLLSRCVAPTINKKQTFPILDVEVFHSTCGTEGMTVVEELQNLIGAVPGLYLSGNIYRGLEQMLSCLSNANAFVQNKEPWSLVKKEDRTKELESVLYLALETLRVCGILLQPIVPNMANILLQKLNVENNERVWKNLVAFPSLVGEKNLIEGRKLGSSNVILFPRLKK